MKIGFSEWNMCVGKQNVETWRNCRAEALLIAKTFVGKPIRRLYHPAEAPGLIVGMVSKYTTCSGLSAVMPLHRSFKCSVFRNIEEKHFMRREWFVFNKKPFKERAFVQRCHLLWKLLFSLKSDPLDLMNFDAASDCSQTSDFMKWHLWAFSLMP